LCVILTLEPGYYEDGSFGIRIENIIRTVPAKARFNFKDRGFLTFEDVTVVPLQTKMFVKSLLSPEEVILRFHCAMFVLKVFNFLDCVRQ